jgi:hypothetical protein
MKKQSLCLLGVAVALGACVTVPERRVVANPPQAQPRVSLAKVYFYPSNGQSEEQQDRDRYECHNWGVRETGFDPSLRLAAGDERGAVVPARSSGQTVGAAAAVGAVIGAIAGGRGDALEGAVVGAMAGTVLGSAAANAQDAEARRVERAGTMQASLRYEKQAVEFRRAMSACLEGRGYSVK